MKKDPCPRTPLSKGQHVQGRMSKDSMKKEDGMMKKN